MNFLLRSAPAVAAEQPSLNENYAVDNTPGPKPVTTLEGLVSDDPFPKYEAVEDFNGTDDGVRGLDGSIAGSYVRSDAPASEKHSDISEDEGWITIPSKELPDDWTDAPDISSLRALDRNFVFPGEQVRILACLSMYEEETEVITPFKVAAVMSKNGIGRSPKPAKENGDSVDGTNLVSGNGEVHQDKQNNVQSDNTPAKEKIDRQKDISAGESLLRKEDRNRKIATLLQRLTSSHFFVRIAESGEMLWSKKGDSQKSSESSDMDDLSSAANSTEKAAKEVSHINTIVDKGKFNANVSGGVARNNVQCCSLANGDVVVLLQINVGIDLLRDPVIEILQFEKYQSKISSSENHESARHANEDPCGGLLTWLLPLENTLPPPARPLSPPALSSGSASGIGSTSGRPNISATSGSQIFSFGNFRSYSMSAIPQNSIPPAATGHSSKSSFDLDEWDRLSKQKPVKSQKTDKEGLLSFRTVLLEPERFSVRCGLEGIYIPGRRWRRKLEIIQPIEIQSFVADCNSDDLLCVQIKNISPEHIPDIVVYIDAITIVLEEATKAGPPLSFPVASIEPGEGYSLPNLALRRGEEHSFIVKPAISIQRKLNSHDRRSTHSSTQPQTKIASGLHVSSKIEEKSSSLPTDHYAVMVSCHCNYTESRLFFKQPTSWRPRVSRDIMISVASEMSREIPGSNAVSQLPVQVLTLQASNLTSEDLTMTILAPASFTSPPTVVSLNSSPSSPISPLFGLTEFQGKFTGQFHNTVPPATEYQRKYGNSESKSVTCNEQGARLSDAILNNDVGCTHLWLQSRVPLGCVPSLTTATIKLELLPLTDGIITLDTLQIDVKEKGRTYTPEHSLKINATSSISTGIM